MFNLFCFSNHISSSYNRSVFACCVFCGACGLGMRLSLLACNIRVTLVESNSGMDEQSVSEAEKPSDPLQIYEQGLSTFEGELKEEDKENPRELKKVRSNSKRELTKAINRVTDILKVGENNDDIEICVSSTLVWCHQVAKRATMVVT